MIATGEPECANYLINVIGLTQNAHGFRYLEAREMAESVCTNLTPDECFALYPPGSEAIIELIRYRLKNPAEGGHEHHLLALGRGGGGKKFHFLPVWSRMLGRRVTKADIPVVYLTGPEHYKVHLEIALCHYAAGNMGRFQAHSSSLKFLAKFAGMAESDWVLHREITNEGNRVKTSNPLWIAENRQRVRARFPDILAIDPHGNRTRYASITEAADKTGCSEQAVSTSINSKRRVTWGKYKGWYFVSVPTDEVYEPEPSIPPSNGGHRNKEIQQSRVPNIVAVSPIGIRSVHASCVDAAKEAGCSSATVRNVIESGFPIGKGRERGWFFYEDGSSCPSNLDELRELSVRKNQTAQQMLHRNVTVESPEGVRSTHAGINAAARFVGCSPSLIRTCAERRRAARHGTFKDWVFLYEGDQIAALRSKSPVMSAAQSRFQDVIAVSPSGNAARFAGQIEAARAIGWGATSIARALNRNHPATQGPLKGWSFRYATPEDAHIPLAT